MKMPWTMACGWALFLACLAPASPPLAPQVAGGTPGGLAMTHPPRPLPPLVLEDQFGHPEKLPDRLDRVVVLVYGDRRGADANKQLGEALHVHFHPTARGCRPRGAPCPGEAAGRRATGDAQPGRDRGAGGVRWQGAALVPSVIRAQFRAASPAVPVWLDFQDQMKQLFGLAAGVPNVAVVDTRGRLRCTASGP